MELINLRVTPVNSTGKEDKTSVFFCDFAFFSFFFQVCFFTESSNSCVTPSFFSGMHAAHCDADECIFGDMGSDPNNDYVLIIVTIMTNVDND